MPFLRQGAQALGDLMLGAGIQRGLLNKSGASALGYGARAAYGFAGLGGLARRTIAGSVGGALAGGTYGAFSDNTSVLGGAFKGAFLGGIGGVAANAAIKGSGVYRGLRGMGQSRSTALDSALRSLNPLPGVPRLASNAPVNPIKGL
jgi:hypothetical protein